MGHGRDGERQHVVDGVVGVPRFAQGSKHEVEADRAGEQEAQAIRAGKAQGAQVIEELDGRVGSLPLLEVVQHEREFVPQHQDDPVAGDADEIVECVGKENLPGAAGRRQVDAGNLSREQARPLGDASLETGRRAGGLLNGAVDRAEEVRDRVHGLEVLVDGQVTALALVPHLQDNVGLANAPLRRDDEPLAVENTPVSGDLAVSAHHVLRVQAPAGVDLHGTLLLASNHTWIMTYVNIGV